MGGEREGDRNRVEKGSLGINKIILIFGPSEDIAS